MTRQPQKTDFHVEVEGVGTFVFAYREMRDELAIQVEYSRITQGVDTPSIFLGQVATWISALKVLTVEAPYGWNIDKLDPLEQESYLKLMNVYAALRAKEQQFRKKPEARGESGGQGNGGPADVLVPSQVQPGTD